ncbi:sensor histidine kinase [Olivibacter sitiensis]|uniref:sensor histidine kinase n=1 Tax=Olivibacter sitiensis TaxID=376470 RepID=UPI0003FF15C4|nr:ATP-binding protein [Olivibacter sitiensis]
MLEPIIGIIFVAFLQRIAKHSENGEWAKQLKLLMLTFIGLLIGGLVYSSLQNLFFLGSCILLGWLCYLIYKEDFFKRVRFLIYAVLPLLFISIADWFIELLAPGFYAKYDDFLENLTILAVIWFFCMWIFTNRQQKALEKERQMRLAENKVMSQAKLELEQQVTERTAQLVKQNKALEKTLTELKNAQTQLIQSEKMASLGELTAGIAHEIQNPLNFVNNFSEVSVELLDELRDTLKDKGVWQESEDIGDLMDDLSQNLEKITYHGKRADSIVKGMLQHSRTTTGVKEEIDLNALIDEYLRLSYHGLRAKDKSFNAQMITDFDPNLKQVKAVPQDLGRVLLNLFNNAFYSVSEKKKNSPMADYMPKVEARTRKEFDLYGNEKVVVTVWDNGLGIPSDILEKIYQPFFTTKPTGQGTGLGLSLSYDIITNGHQGELKVDTKAREYAQFTITLPVA